MSKLIKMAALAAAVSVLVSSAGIAAKKPVKKVVKKPATTNHAKLGTTQLKSLDNPEFGGTYTLGKSDPMNITVKSAEYSVEPLTIGEYTYTANKDEKLLILHMTYHNPQPRERFTRWDSFKFTVVDPKDQNHDGLKDLGTDEPKPVGFSMSMKPAQKSQVIGIVVVPAETEMPKLIIKSDDDLVLRYDLRNKVKGLPAPYADPADKTGATALAKITATAGTAYPVGVFTYKLNKAEFSSATKLGQYDLGEGERFLIVSTSVKNISAREQFFRWDSFQNKIIDVDGAEVASGATDLFTASRDKGYGGNIQPGQEMNLRYIYKVPSDASLKYLTVNDGNNGRTFEFDISDTK